MDFAATSNRRMLLAAASIFLAGPVAAQQRSRLARIAVLEWEPVTGADRLRPFREAMQAEGFVEGRNLQIDAFFSDGRLERVEALAAQIAQDQYDLVVAFATPAAHAAKRAITRIPIVFGAADPLGTGLVSNLARPGGNLTGVSSMISDIEAKRLSLLRELMPNLERVAYIASTSDPAAERFIAEAQAAGGVIGVTVMPQTTASPEGVEAAVEAASRAGAKALIIQPLFTLSNHSSAAMAEIVRRRRIPAIGTYAPFARSGGLVSFGPALEFARRRTAMMAAKILAGANPGDMPVEQPTEFLLTINLAAARDLGIVVPPLVLARADEVIE